MKKFELNEDDCWICGVCSGLAEYTDIDVMFIRIVFLMILFLGNGWITMFYVLAAICAPVKNNDNNG